MSSRLVLLMCLGMVILGAGASAEVIAELEDPRPGDIQIAGFELKKDAKVNLEARAAGEGWKDQYYCYSWIINADTREPIWAMGDTDEDRVDRKKVLRETHHSLSLPAGKYELYQYTHDYRNGPIIVDGFRGLVNVFGDMFDEDYEHDLRRAIRDCYVRLESEDIAQSDIQQFEATGAMPNAVLQMTGIMNTEMVSKGISLKEPMDFRVYAIFEQPDDRERPVDHAWIIDAKTRERVWELDDRSSGWAGGGEKNRIFDGTVSLPAGDYVVHYATDDSHSWEGFNVNPPFDPMNWGITLLPGQNFKPGSFSLFVPAGRSKPIIDLTRARDDRLYESGFQLERDGNINVVALGEYDEDDERFADYAWIEDAKTGDLVWEMTDRNTVPGGGASKNRLFDGVVELPKGDYVLRYVTDGSHAFRSWNGSQPYDPSAWGVAIYGVEGGPQGVVKEVGIDDIDQSQGVLARLNRAGDNEYLRKEFKLDKPSSVRIYALGEGERDQMHDYAWIEDADSRRVVWEMTYRNTDRAGGARKNRMFDNVIKLDAGTYVVYYESDGSHSFNDWNDDRPDDPTGWGVTVRLADK